MKIQVVIPVPTESEEAWVMFKPYIQRFCDTWRQYPPGVRCTLFAVTQGVDSTDEIRDIFTGLPTRFVRHDHGMDLGAQQYIAMMSDDAFQVNMTSRCYFHRENWLARMVSARIKHGPALYGISTSREGGRMHICTRGHAYDVDTFKLYPHDITSRNQGVFFEVGSGNLLKFYRRIGMEGYVVFWCGERMVDDLTFIEGGFRDGDQGQMLFFDKHTDYYAAADDQEKERLRSLMLGLTPELVES